MNILKDRAVKTRKPHRCWWCGEAIESRALAVYQVSVDAGDFMATYAHPECDDACQRSDDPFQEGWPLYSQRRGMADGEEISLDNPNQ